MLHFQDKENRLYKALQNLYHAVSGSTTTKVNISKLLVDIHYAITGVESSVKNNWSRIIDSMATNWPEGGGGGGGSSAFSTAEVTFITNQSGCYASIYGAITDISSQMGYPTSLTAIATADAEIANGDVYTVALYNGYAYVGTQAGNITVSGNATAEEYIPEDTLWLITITGDCTITIS